MNIEKFKQLTNDVIDAHQKMVEKVACLEDFSREHGVEFVRSPYSESEKTMQIYKGIEKLSEVLGGKTIVKPRADTEYPYELSFTHDGIKFFQIQEENPNLKEEI